MPPPPMPPEPIAKARAGRLTRANPAATASAALARFMARLSLRASLAPTLWQRSHAVSSPGRPRRAAISVTELKYRQVGLTTGASGDSETFASEMRANRPIRVAALVDLPRSPQAGGHVKCWERLAHAAADGGLPLDLTVYFSGRRADRDARTRRAAGSPAAGVLHRPAEVPALRAGSHRPGALPPAARPRAGGLRRDPHHRRLLRLRQDRRGRQPPARHSADHLVPHRHAVLHAHLHAPDHRGAFRFRLAGAGS